VVGKKEVLAIIGKGEMIGHQTLRIQASNNGQVRGCTEKMAKIRYVITSVPDDPNLQFVKPSHPDHVCCSF